MIYFNLVKYSKLLLLLCVMLLLIVPVHKAYAQQASGTGGKIIKLTTMLEKYHVRPREVNDSLSKDIFNSFIKTHDPYQLIFTRADYESLVQFRNTLDDEMLGGEAAFIEFFIPLYKQRLNDALTLIDQAALQPVEIMKPDTFWYERPKGIHYPDASSVQLAKWRRLMKLGILETMFDDRSLNDTIMKLGKAQLLQMEPEMRQRAKLKEDRWIRRILDSPEGMENLCLSLYLNAITGCYDPHSSYFSMESMKIFESELSDESYLFGFDIAENESGNIYISGIIPGGPAWKSNELNVGDILTSIEWLGSKPVDLSFATADEVASLLSSSVSKVMKLSVRKADGRSVTITLLKEKIRSQDNVVTSYILQGDKKVGYICLPAFYSDFESHKNLGCANDVAKEILKLQKEGIEGLILDLQYNGGGSVKEAVDLAGIFIEAGPICVFSSRNEKPFTLKDMNMGTAYIGPLLIMVNGYSASASEIVSGALQDYHRALIVGTPTFGKSTGQAVMPMDTILPGNNKYTDDNESPNGFIKVTTNQVYRITGESHQLTGVQPDIVLPDPFYNPALGEKAEPFAFPNDRISKKTYYTALPPLPVDTLSALSGKRIGQSAYMKICRELSDSLSRKPDKPFMLIDMMTYRDREYSSTQYYNVLDSIAEEVSSPFEVTNNAFDNELLLTDEYYRSVNDLALERLNDDVFLMEAYNIMRDLIIFTKK